MGLACPLYEPWNEEVDWPRAALWHSRNVGDGEFSRGEELSPEQKVGSALDHGGGESEQAQDKESTVHDWQGAQRPHGCATGEKKKKEIDLVPRSERKLKGSSRERRTIVQVVDGGGMKLRLRDGTHNGTQCTVDPECVTKIHKWYCTHLVMEHLLICNKWERSRRRERKVDNVVTERKAAGRTRRAKR